MTHWSKNLSKLTYPQRIDATALPPTLTHFGRQAAEHSTSCFSRNQKGHSGPGILFPLNCLIKVSNQINNVFFSTRIMFVQIHLVIKNVLEQNQSVIYNLAAKLYVLFWMSPKPATKLYLLCLYIIKPLILDTVSNF